MTPIYLDNAATTQLRPEVIDEMTKVLKEHHGNPSSTHSFGRSSKAVLEQCRKRVASHFNVLPSEIVFTSGGTEADNLILRSAVRDLGVQHIITSKIEHHAVTHTAEHLALEYGIKLSYVSVDSTGVIDMSHLESLLKSNEKSLVSLMHVNNEIGTILDIETVAKLCKSYNALFHSDTVQSVGHYHLDLSKVPIDFIAASAHKFHGPKGVGFAFIRQNSGLKPLILGGEQERGYRAGTESIHDIVGLDIALDLAYQNITSESQYVKELKAHFVNLLASTIKEVKFNGGSDNMSTNTYTLVNVCLPVSQEKKAMFLFQLDLKGIACSKGSACQSGSDNGSHVLKEILDELDLNKPSVRFSFSKYNTKEELTYVVDTLVSLI